MRLATNIRKVVRNELAYALILCTGLFLGGCGGGESAFTNDDGTTTDTTGGTGGGGTTVAAGVQIGYVNTSGSFVPSTIDVATSPISNNGGTTNLTVALWENGARYTASTLVTFSATCSTASFNNNPISTNTSLGEATVTYTSNSCTGSDTVTATISTTDANGNPTTVSATGTVESVVPTTTTYSLEYPYIDPQIFDTGTDNITNPGSTFDISVTVLDDLGNKYITPVTINFTSDCVSSNLSSLSASAVETVNGTAKTTYTAEGCTSDTVTATANVLGNPLQITRSFTITKASVTAIEFTSISDNYLGIKGTGGTLPESATVVFTVYQDVNGVKQPLADQTVNFSLGSGVEATLTTSTIQTDTAGKASTVIQSSTKYASAVVSASTVSGIVTFTTQSTPIVITDGVPDVDSFTLTIDAGNVRAWDIANASIPISVKLGDHYNIGVPNATVVFTTEWGSITGDNGSGSCVTGANGVCNVTWDSSLPKDDPRSTVTAYVLGAETFADINGNGLYEGTDSKGKDIGELYQDYNESGAWESGEPFDDENGNGIRDGGDGIYNGILCNDIATVCNKNQVKVKGDLVIVMGSDNNYATRIAPYSCTNSTYTDQTNCEANGGTWNLSAPIVLNSGTTDITFVVEGTAGQYPPVGTTITFTTTNGTILSSESISVPPALPGPTSVFTGKVTMTESAETPTSVTSGILTIKVNSAGYENSIFIQIIDSI